MIRAHDGGVVRTGIDIPGTVPLYPWNGSVVGYDDSPIARLGHVNLMMVGQNTEGLTGQAVKAIVERLDSGRTHQREVVVHPQLVIRGQTGQAAK